MGSAGVSGKEYAVGFQIVGVVLWVSGFTAVVVHHHDQNMAVWEIARIERQARLEIARIEGDGKLSEQFWKAKVERYKYVLELAHGKNYAPYQTAISKNKKKKEGTGGLEEEKEKD